ncbi:MAG: S16 family serine protease, partial [Bacteroidota bacterium]
AIPKDGPSAGITILSSLASQFSQRLLKANLAMTGEITLRGKVLPVGGIKEKVLAAKRAGIKTIILCQENQKDVSEIKESYVQDLEFIYVTKMSEVIGHALEMEPVKNAKRLLPKKKESEKAAEKDLNRIEQIRKIVAQA